MKTNSMTHSFKLYLILGLSLVLTLFTFNARAETITSVDDEAPAFQNPAQAQHAEQLSALTAQEPDAEAIAAVGYAEQKTDELESAKIAVNTLKEADSPATPEQIEAAEAAYEAALEACEQAQATADQRMAAFAGLTSEEIQDMRDDGMGWGQIAHELGIHPGALGLGHTKGNLHRNRTAEMEKKGSDLEAATARNVKTGWSKGHGISGSESEKNGQNKEKSNQGKSDGKSGGNGGGNGGGKK